MIAASPTRPTVAEEGRGQGTVWHTLRVRAVAVITLAVAAVAGTVASAAPARTPASAGGGAAVVRGPRGPAARAPAPGDDGTSRSAPSDTPDGVELGGGSVS